MFGRRLLLSIILISNNEKRTRTAHSTHTHAHSTAHMFYVNLNSWPLTVQLVIFYLYIMSYHKLREEKLSVAAAAVASVSVSRSSIRLKIRDKPLMHVGEKEWRNKCTCSKVNWFVSSCRHFFHMDSFEHLQNEGKLKVCVCRQNSKATATDDSEIQKQLGPYYSICMQKLFHQILRMK